MATPAQCGSTPLVDLRLRFALALIGFTSVIAQIVLMRELFVVCHGNELSLGLTIAVWLFWTAFGSGILGHLFRHAAGRQLLAFLEVACAAALPGAIVVARASRSWWHATPGETLGPVPMIVAAVATLAVFCPMSGWLFTAGSRAYAEAAGETPSTGASSTYLFEAIGSAAGGVLASLLLIRYFNSMQIAGAVAACNVVAAVCLVVSSAPARRAVAILAVTAGVAAVFFASRWESYAAAGMWPGFRVLATKTSPYGSLAVLESEGNRSVVQNGNVLFTAPDPPSAEEAVHFALLEHPHPRAVLLIGGGLNGSLAEILQYRGVERIDYVELDPAVLALAGEFFPEQWRRLSTEPRIHPHAMDGRLFLKTAGRKFDVVILNLPDPHTAQLNRFYTEEFFREVAAALNPGGVLSFQLRAAEEYISPELAEFLRCIHATLRRAFRDVAILPGETAHFIASNPPGTVTADADTIVRRLHERGIQTLYVREYYLPFRLAPERVEEMQRQVSSDAGTRLNRDFSPIAYYFDVALWSAQFSDSSRTLFRAAAAVRFDSVLAFLLVVLAFLALFLTLHGDRQRLAARSAACAVFLMGLTLIGAEVLLLLGFQAIYGYVFQQLAWIVAGFMAGLAVGSWRALRLRETDHGLRRLLAVQILAMFLPLAVFALLAGLSHIRQPAAIAILAFIVFPALALACGLLGGFQFPIAMRVFFKESPGRHTPGYLYALDLAGSALGALAITVYLLPVFGLFRTAIIMAVGNLLPVVLMAAAIAPRPTARARVPACFH